MNYLTHYYGDDVRKLLFTCGLIMLVTLPVFNAELPVSPSISLFAIVVLILSAAITSPRNRVGTALDMLVSITGLIIFGHQATVEYGRATTHAGQLFWIAILLSLLFAVATYLSVKTLRGFRGRYQEEAELT